MAIWNLTRGIEVRDCPWGQIFTGTREDLIAAGIVALGAPFPGDRGAGKTRSTYLEGAREIRIERHGVRRFDVYRDFETDKERAAAEERERERLERARGELAKLPSVPYGQASALLAQLARRYPGIDVTDASIEAWEQRGTIVQCVKYRAPLARLLESGLLTEAMIDAEWGPRRQGRKSTPIGDGFYLDGDEDLAELTLYTHSAPLERNLSTREAARLLRRFGQLGERDAG